MSESAPLRVSQRCLRSRRPRASRCLSVSGPRAATVRSTQSMSSADRLNLPSASGRASGTWQRSRQPGSPPDGTASSLPPVGASTPSRGPSAPRGRSRIHSRYRRIARTPGDKTVLQMQSAPHWTALDSTRPHYSAPAGAGRHFKLTLSRIITICLRRGDNAGSPGGDCLRVPVPPGETEIQSGGPAGALGPGLPGWQGFGGRARASSGAAPWHGRPGSWRGRMRRGKAATGARCGYRSATFGPSAVHDAYSRQGKPAGLLPGTLITGASAPGFGSEQ